MSLTNLTSRDIEKITRLIEKKESLQSHLTEIDQQLTALEGGTAPAIAAPRVKGRPGRKPKAIAMAEAPAASAAPAPVKRGRPGKPARRGAMKEGIIQALQTAGKGGISFKDLADRLGTKYGNVSVWFQTTGKTVQQVKKVGPARYAWAQ